MKSCGNACITLHPYIRGFRSQSDSEVDNSGRLPILWEFLHDSGGERRLGDRVFTGFVCPALVGGVKRACLHLSMFTADTGLDDEPPYVVGLLAPLAASLLHIVWLAQSLGVPTFRTSHSPCQHTFGFP